jgi:hypothetical protein
LSNWYIDNTASGNNDGTSWANAWQNHGTAIVWGNIVPGDIVYFSGGSATTTKTYTGVFEPGASGSAGAQITFRAGQDADHNGIVTFVGNSAYGGISPSSDEYLTFNGEYNGDCHFRVTGSSDRGIRIMGSCMNLIFTYMEIDNNGSTNDHHGIHIDMNVFEPMTALTEISYCKLHDNYGDQIHCNGPTGLGTMWGRIKVHHNEIYNLWDDGLESTAGGTDFYENTVHTLAGVSNHPDAIQALNGYCRIYNNTMYNLHGSGISPNSYIFVDLWNGTATTGHVRVYNNHCYYSAEPVDENDYCRGMEIKVESNKTSVTDVLVANNTIAGFPAWGLVIDWVGLSAATNTEFYNNIVFDCYQKGGGEALAVQYYTGCTIGAYGGSAALIIDYNAINAGPDGAGWSAEVGTQSGGVIADPQLGDPSLKLQSGSPAIDAGVDLSAYFTQDLDGVTRVVSWEMGAYEYTGQRHVMVLA